MPDHEQQRRRQARIASDLEILSRMGRGIDEVLAQLLVVGPMSHVELGDSILVDRQAGAKPASAETLAEWRALGVTDEWLRGSDEHYLYTYSLPYDLGQLMVQHIVDIDGGRFRIAESKVESVRLFLRIAVGANAGWLGSRATRTAIMKREKSHG